MSDNDGNTTTVADRQLEACQPDKAEEQSLKEAEKEVRRNNDGNATTVADRQLEACQPDKAEAQSLKEAEKDVRRKASHGPIYLFLLNGFSSVAIFIVSLISIETLLSMALGITLTIYVYYETEDNPGYDGTAMDFVLLSFAIITPLSASIGITFQRREQALDHISVLRATMVELYIAHASWDWAKYDKPSSGRVGTPLDSLKHADAVMTEMVGVGDELSRFLTLPNASRARHRVSPMGKKEAKRTKNVSSRLFDSILKRMGRISLYCEVLKEYGLPPNEATRLRQWERMCLERMEKLQMIKKYRSPQALRSFGRLFSVFFPPFYAPYYAQLARELESLAMGIVFAALTSLALTALFESIAQIEDPFLDVSLDGVDVEDELTVVFDRDLLSIREELFKNSAPFSGEMEEEHPEKTPMPRILTE